MKRTVLCHVPEGFPELPEDSPNFLKGAFRELIDEVISASEIPAADRRAHRLARRRVAHIRSLIAGVLAEPQVLGAIRAREIELERAMNKVPPTTEWEDRGRKGVPSVEVRQAIIDALRLADAAFESALAVSN